MENVARYAIGASVIVIIAVSFLIRNKLKSQSGTNGIPSNNGSSRPTGDSWFKRRKNDATRLWNSSMVKGFQPYIIGLGVFVLIALLYTGYNGIGSIRSSKPERASTYDSSPTQTAPIDEHSIRTDGANQVTATPSGKVTKTATLPLKEGLEYMVMISPGDEIHWRTTAGGAIVWTDQSNAWQEMSATSWINMNDVRTMRIKGMHGKSGTLFCTMTMPTDRQFIFAVD